MASDGADGVAFRNLTAGGQVGALIRAKDWSATPLGPRSSWPRSLDNYLNMILQLPTAAIVFWGDEQIQLYNDGYAVIMGPRHPGHLGSTFRHCWPEAYATIHPWMLRVLQEGETVEVNRTLVALSRFGFTEEAYFTFSFSPLRDDQGRIAGILQLVTEVTASVLGERRAALLNALSLQTAQAITLQDAPRLALDVLADALADLPFSLLYTVGAAGQLLTLAGCAGLSQDEQPFPERIDLQHPVQAAALPELVQVLHDRKPVVVEPLATRFPSLRASTWPETPQRALALPIVAADQQTVVGVLVGGISPRLALDAAYQGFLQLVCAQIGTLMAAARARDDEVQRVQALAAIDRAKTEFFSNVSHEFRTPLTLILGLVEDAIARSPARLEGEDIDVLHRNGVRLLRLVNSLLDFTRIEADRLRLAFEPCKLSTLTTELASAFLSLVERAGMRLVVDCPPLPEPVYVDPSQWEKIVLNLVSNAFKFTFHGEIEVSLRWHGDHVQLRVRDTGTGIPAHELPHIFDRFHRVAQSRGRSFEGSGIGLALVQQLVQLHGGSVRVESSEGRGSTFIVTLPTGKDHLPADQVVRASEPAAPALPSSSYVLEASRWVSPRETRPGEGSVSGAAAAHSPAAPLEAGRILVVDDNGDMREYLARLLRAHWEVEAVAHAQAALSSARARPPDLILSDVMMPGLDGFGLLRALRSDDRTRMVPVILLSARAGEEAVLEGLDHGADDYLAKPFTTQELIARVRTHLTMARSRNALNAELARTNQELEAFSHSVAHDLRGPLLGIDGFSSILLAEHGDELSPEAHGLVNRVLQSTQAMGQMIDDLLMLSRVGRNELQRTQVDLSALAEEVAGVHRAREPERLIEVSIAPGLVAHCDGGLLRIALDNLFGNAWKYTGRQPQARIEFGATVNERGVVYFVRDNGAGFDMKHSGKLFTAFARLHAASEFPGSGIGLATVQRIVQRHGGSIWAQGEVGAGAVFYFTLC
jgi:signal transduction histidine kinase